MIFIVGSTCFTLVVVIILYLFLNRMSKTKRHVCVVVLGDIGRSPRMQYHSLSFVKQEWRVDIIGYGGSTPHKDLLQSENVHIHKMREPPGFIKYLPRLFVYFLKAIWQSVTLLLAMISVGEPSHCLLQNPPAIPTLAVLWFICALRDCHLVVDWHNYGYTILGLAVGARHPLFRFSKWYEKFFGYLADANICVTEAMKKDLAENWEISAQTMYDRPPEMFCETNLEEQHRLFMKLTEEYAVFKPEGAHADNMTVFTQENSYGVVSSRKQRPALLVSSTSWTEDEDFSILLSALEHYEERASLKANHKLPNLICVITGKGPQKEHYKSLINKKSWQHVQICTPWLTAEDYPKLLGSADLGVCLHKSSSGLDLPMKVVDMFGCGVPVCAVQFNCLHELVKHEENGLIFSSADELAEQLQDLLASFPNNHTKLSRFRQNLRTFQKLRWEDEWTQKVLPLFQ